MIKPDHVVTLQSDVAEAAMTQGKAALVAKPMLKPGAPAPLPASAIVLSLAADAPRGRFRVRLWDDDGRNPTDPARGRSLDFTGSLPQPMEIPLVPHKGFDGGTLTWVVRLQASGAAQTYSVRLAVLEVHGGTRKTSAEFVYSGALDNVEEITGRFHFKVSP